MFRIPFGGLSILLFISFGAIWRSIGGLLSGIGGQWGMRAWIDTSYIVHMNSLLRTRHQTRIGRTPFRWCLYIIKPLEASLKLVKKMVCRWVGHHESFRVSQHQLPFNAVDGLMTLGLGVGGLEVSYDESVVGKVGEMFNPKRTNLKDLMNMFDGLVLNDAIEVEFDWYLSDHDRQQSLIRAAFHMDDGARPECSRAAVERHENEGEHSWESEAKEKMRRNNLKIKRLREKMKGVQNELHLLRKCRKVQEDRSGDVKGNDDGADHPVYEKPVGEADEGGVGEADEGVVGELLEEPAAEVDEGGVGEVHEQPAAKVDEGGVGKVHEQPAAEVDEGGVGEVHELPDVVVDEGGVGEVPEQAAALVDEGSVGEVPKQAAALVDEGRVGEVPEQPVAEVDEGRVGEVDVGEGDYEPGSEAAEEPLCVHREHPPAVIDIGEDEEGDVIVELMSVRPLRTYVGDPRTQVDLDKLYNSVSAKGIEQR
ncbi:hypothetical protein LR48_Vigan11g075700 [Vigna angularis]|uniref:Aminotransferase-like plant mobile domain-containing protein n=1 Tax=Phaseolus angularis TaxID=3914 RepID=A0A0L9VSI4_PHAAN|nr:hypothetical protein LR48_Vigan11g075700 [Vigna angularis]